MLVTCTLVQCESRVSRTSVHIHHTFYLQRKQYTESSVQMTISCHFLQYSKFPQLPEGRGGRIIGNVPPLPRWTEGKPGRIAGNLPLPTPPRSMAARPWTGGKSGEIAGRRLFDLNSYAAISWEFKAQLYGWTIAGNFLSPSTEGKGGRIAGGLPRPPRSTEGERQRIAGNLQPPTSHLPRGRRPRGRRQRGRAGESPATLNLPPPPRSTEGRDGRIAGDLPPPPRLTAARPWTEGKGGRIAGRSLFNVN